MPMQRSQLSWEIDQSSISPVSSVALHDLYVEWGCVRSWHSLRISLWFDVMMEQKTPSFESHDRLLGILILHRFETQHHVEIKQLQLQMEEAGPRRDIWKPNWSPWTLNENTDQYISLYFILDLHCLRHVRHSFRWGSGPKKQRKKGK